jgi:alpha-D-ribose 1-methylphosphonate 5-triphosphate synthase subunit PhnH
MTPGFADPVHDAQRAFRACLAALSRPGRPVHVCGAAAPAFAPWSQAATALLLSLADGATPVWASGQPQEALEALRFHAGAPVAARSGQALFAVIGPGDDWPPLEAFEQGQDDFPERAATLIIEVDAFQRGPTLRWKGPGIAGTQDVSIAGLPADFAARWSRNHGCFPCGVDILFTCGRQALGLPRSIQVGVPARVGSAGKPGQAASAAHAATAGLARGPLAAGSRA